MVLFIPLSNEIADRPSKGHHSNGSASTGRITADSSPPRGQDSENTTSEHYGDDLAEASFKNKLLRFENLANSQQEDRSMSLPSNPHKFSYMNYVGEKLFTRDTNTTRLSVEGSDIAEDFLLKKDCNGSDPLNKPPKPEIKPKPIVGLGKPKPRMESKSSGNPTASPTSSRPEFKTLSMISTETSIWGSTSSAGTFKMDDDARSSISCQTPIDDIDVFGDEMTASLSMKHQQMVSSWFCSSFNFS